MKRIIAAFLCLALAITAFGACGGNNQAERDLSAQLTLIKNMNETSLKLVYGAMNTSEEDAALQKIGLTAEQAISVVANYISPFDYEIVSSSLDGDNATVQVNMTTYDFNALAPTILGDFVNNNLSSILTGDSSELSSKAVESINATLKAEGAPLKTQQYDISMAKGSKIYEIVVDEPFVEALSGGAMSFLRSRGLDDQADALLSTIQSYVGSKSITVPSAAD